MNIEKSKFANYNTSESLQQINYMSCQVDER